MVDKNTPKLTFLDTLSHLHHSVVKFNRKVENNSFFVPSVYKSNNFGPSLITHLILIRTHVQVDRLMVS